MRDLVVVALALVLSAGISLNAQTATGAIIGAVRDPATAVVPTANITLTNIGTNEKRTAATNQSGAYSFPLLPPATYRVEAEAPGFKRYIRDNIKLDVGLVATVDISLELGATTDQVTVTADAPALEEGTSSLGHVIENQRIVNLPLNGRNSYGFAALVPGVRSSAGFSQVAYSMYNDQFVSINGSRANQNSFLLDGGANSEPAFNGPAMFPSVDAVQEYKVQTNNFSAEFSDTTGGVINVVTKSGTNQLHGALYEFLRNDKLDANDFFVNRSGKSKATYRFNQFGATAGGPVQLSKVYRGRDRTFFFASYEGLRWVRGVVASGTMPTDPERRGDFSRTLNQNGQLIAAYDPLTSAPDPSRPGRFIRSPFPGNVIPSARIDPVSANLLKWIPRANAPGNLLTNTNNFLSNDSGVINKNEFSARLDHAITDRQKLFGRFSMNNTGVDRPAIYGKDLYASAAVMGVDHLNQRQVTLNYTNLLRPTLVLEVSSSFLRYYLARQGTGVGFDTTQLGFPNYFRQLPGIPCFGQWGVTGLGVSIAVPDIGGGFLSHCGILNDGYETFHEYGNLTNVRGAHTLKMGADFGAKRLSTGRYGVTSPNFNFSPNFTQGPDPLVATNNGGAGFASFLIGLGSGSVRSDGPGQSLLYRYFGGYFQDDWKATARLTLNLGIRYDYSGPWTERYNRITDLDYTSLSPLQIAGLQLKGGLQFPGVNGVPRGQFDPDRTDIAPRFGFAYALNSKTVLRGGFGIFIGPPTGGGFNGAVAISGFESFTTWVSSVDGITPTNYLSNPFPDGFVKATGSGKGLGTLLGQSISGNDRGTRMPHAEQWNFDMQRTIPGNFLLDISYAGSRGLHLMGNLEYDALPNQYLSQGDTLRQLTPNPFLGTITNGPLAVPQIQRGQLLRPYPQFTGVNARSVSYGASTYHALQAKFERRFSKGFSFLAAYTFSKLMDDVTMTTGFGGESFYGGGIQDWGNRRNERAPAVWDAPHTLAMNWVWDLPIGPHRKFLGDRKWLGAIAGNWQINGITLLRSGVPLQLTTSANTLNNYSGAQRPNWSGTDPHVGGPISKRIDRYFDPAAFVSPPPYTFGNVPRSIGNLRGPGVASFDFSLFRNIPLTEKATLQFRCETFNVLNHPQFGLPNTSIGNPSAGVISSQVNQPRDIQFALKLLY